MVLEHVAHHAGLFVVAGAVLDATVSAAVICTWWMYLRFQIGSKMELAKRNTRRFCTVSLPR